MSLDDGMECITTNVASCAGPITRPLVIESDENQTTTYTNNFILIVCCVEVGSMIVSGRQDVLGIQSSALPSINQLSR
jgi:hypothetical protein